MQIPPDFEGPSEENLPAQSQYAARMIFPEQSLKVPFLQSYEPAFCCRQENDMREKSLSLLASRSPVTPTHCSLASKPRFLSSAQMGTLL